VCPQIAASGLEPGKQYALSLTGLSAQKLMTFTPAIGGIAIAQTLGPLKRVVSIDHSSAAGTLEVRSADGKELVLQQKE
jgi:hypothetical protein